MYEVLFEEASKLLHASAGAGRACERLRFQDRIVTESARTTGREGVGSISVLSISSAVLIRTT